MERDRSILNQEWEEIHLSNVDRPTFREKTEEERQLEYFHKGEAIDMDYVLDLNPNIRAYFASMLDSGAAVEVPLDYNGELRHLIQLTEDPELGEPAYDIWDERAWTDKL